MDSNPSAPPPQVLTASGPGSRVTVVCGECKRLKLKCDRRTPCSSCIKRDAISRCVYSPAAAERIDLQSLHNRVVTLETTIQSLLANGLRRAAPQTEYERSVLATGPSGSSSIVVSLEDVASVWLEQLEILKDVDLRVSAPEYHNGPSRLKMAFPDMSLFIDDASDPGRPQVTLKLIQQLPDRQTCEQLLNHLQVTMQMHPSVNFPNYRRRVEAMLDPSLYTAGDDDNAANRPSLAFFAAAAGGLALGARTAIATPTDMSIASQAGISPPPQPNTHPPGGPPPSSSQSSRNSQQSGATTSNLENTADGLFMLSKQALAVSEFEQNYDLDFIHAVILNGLFLLHDGKPRVAHTIYPTVGKLVNICRMMGLHIDPDEFQGKYNLFDAEARRRTWWDVYYYDLFLSDSMGQEPLIDDLSCTTRLPEVVDEEAFLPSSTSLPPPRPQSTSAYFIQKCRLAQLIKKLRRRWVGEQATIEMWVEAATDFEQDITKWLNELPPEFQMPSQAVDPSTLPPVSPYLVAQRSELAAMANSLILKAYTPLLKRSMNDKPAQSAHREAHYVCLHAAHIIVNACHDLFSAFGQTRPASYVFYSFGRQIFAAAAISASIVIQTPQSLVAGPAMKDLERALGLMRNPVVANARGFGYGFAGAGAECTDIAQPLPNSSLRIVEMLHARATEALATGGSSNSAVATGTKRKHVDVDGGGNGSVPHGFAIPFVGSSLVTGPSATTANSTMSSLPARPPSPPGGPGPNKTRPRSGTGTNGVRRTRGLPSAPSDAGESQVSGGGGTSSRPATRMGLMDAPPDPIPTLHPPASSNKKKGSSSRGRGRGHPAIGVRNRTKLPTSRSQDERSVASSEGTSSTIPSLVNPASVNGCETGVMSAPMSETSSRPPTSKSDAPRGHPSKPSLTVDFSSPGRPSPFRASSSLPGDVQSVTPTTTGMPRSLGGSSYGAMQTDAHSAHPYGGSSSSSARGGSSVSQRQRPPPSLFSASDQFVSHSASSSPRTSAFMLPPSSPYGPHTQSHEQSPCGPSPGSQDMPGMGMNPTRQDGNTPPTPHSISAHAYSHHTTQLPPQHHQHHQDTHMHNYSPTPYDTMVQNGSMNTIPHDNALPFGTQPATNSPLGGPSYAASELDMKPFGTFHSFDPGSASSAGDTRSSGAGASLSGEAGPGDSPSAGALASGQRTPMPYGGDSNHAPAQWPSFHPYGPPSQQQQQLPQQHPQLHSLQPHTQAPYSGQHWGSDPSFYDA